MRIFLARHGESTHNALGKFSGQGNIALTAFGRKQAGRSGKFFSGKKIDAVFYSDLKRAKDTAHIIAKKISPLPKMFVRKALREVDCGSFEGKRPEDLKGRQRILEQKWKKNHFRVRLPKGENFFDLQKRAKTVLEEVLASGFENVIIVSHHGTSMVLVKLLLGLSESEAMEIPMPNNVLFEVTISGKSKKIKKIILR